MVKAKEIDPKDLQRVEAGVFKLTKVLKNALEDVKQKERRSMSEIIYFLVLRGLADYRKSGGNLVDGVDELDLLRR